jgi:hypothetical protein
MRSVGDLKEIFRPEQPILPVCEAHVHSHVVLPAVPFDDGTDQAPALGDPVAFSHPDSCADECFFGTHDARLPFESSADTFLPLCSIGVDLL